MYANRLLKLKSCSDPQRQRIVQKTSVMHVLTFQPLPVFYQLPAIHITWQNIILFPINLFGVFGCIFHLGVVLTPNLKTMISEI